MQQTSERGPKEFRGKSVGEIVQEALDEVEADMDFLGREKPAEADRYYALKDVLTSMLRKRLATLHDEYVTMLQEELRSAEEQLSVLQDDTYSELRNEIKFKEQLVCFLLYYFNNGDSLEVSIENIERFSDVEFGYQTIDEDNIEILAIEEQEK